MGVIRCQNRDLELLTLENMYPDVMLIESEDPKITYMVDGTNQIGITVGNLRNKILLTGKQALMIAKELAEVYRSTR